MVNKDKIQIICISLWYAYKFGPHINAKHVACTDVDKNKIAVLKHFALIRFSNVILSEASVYPEEFYMFQVYNSITDHLFTTVSSLLPSTLSPLYPLLPPLHSFPSGNHHTITCAYEVYLFFLITSPFSASPTAPLPSLWKLCSVLYLWVSFYLVYFVH